MRQRHNPLRIWRRYHIGRWTFSIALVTVLMASVLTGGALIHASPSKTASVQRSATWPKRPSVKDEGAWFQLSHFDNKTPPANGRSLALQQAAKLPVSRIGATVKTGGAASGSGISTSATWAPLGPQPIACGDSSCGNTSFDSGRITAIAVNPLSGSDIWVGAADGGLWHSTDGGSTWATVTDNQPTLSIGSIAIDPTNSKNIYVGTGEGNFNADSYGGDGVLKSTDGGATWTLTGQSELGGLGIPRIAVDPFNGNNILAAVDFTGAGYAPYGGEGIWESTDAGQTWTRRNVGAPNYEGTDVVFDPAHSGVAYAGVVNNGIYETTDHGVSWTLLGGLPNGSSFGRIGLGISADGNKLYAAIDSGGLLNGDIYTATLNGTVWTWSAHPVPASMANDGGEYQWWYDIYAMVDPTVSAGTTAYIGGVDLWRTTDGGVTWTNLTDYYNSLTDVHPDQHALAFLPGSSSYYLGNDGGIWKGTPGGSFTDLNGGGLNITQFYSGSIGEVGGYSQLYGGAQDNGEIQYPVGAVTGATTWTEVFGGDGGDTAVDYTNNANVYEEYTQLQIYKSPFGGGNGGGGLPVWFPATNGINIPSGSNCAATHTCEPANFIAPFVMSPTNPNVLVAGTDRVYITSDGAQNWHAISPVLDTPCSNCVTPLSALAIGGSNQYIYAGDNGGNVYVTTNGGGSWSGGALASIEPGLITGLAVDPTNPNVAYASVNGFAGSSLGPGYHLFKTTNAGGSWTDVSQSLPDIPFESITVDPANHNLIVAGGDVGVFISTDAGATWARLGTGLPNAVINQVFFDHTGGSLFVATHGRGMWTLAIPQITTNPTSLLETTPVNTNAASQTFTLTDSGTGTLNWTTSNLPSWVANVSPSSGSLAPGTSQQVTITYSTSSYATPQTLKGSITISDPNAGNSPYSVPVQVVVDNISKTWYFAEGHTGDTFTEFLTLENPNSSSTNVQVQYLLGGGQSPISATYVVGANARSTIRVNNAVGAPQDVSMVVTASQPIVAERPLYFTYNGLPGYSIPGGSDVLGATSLNSSFDFGYLDTSTGHDTWLTVLNQNSANMDVHVSYYPAAGGSPIVRIHTFAANSRGTIHVNREGLPAGSYSALVSLTQQGNTTPALGLVERPLYLVDSGTGDSGSADVVGVSQPLSSWYFAEGYTGPTFAERYILSNPGVSSVSATVTFYLAGGGTQSANVSIAAGAQAVVNANSVLGSSVNNSAVVTSTGGPILAERFMSFNYNGGVGGGPGIPGGIQGASDVLGASAPAQLFEFAEGYTGPTFAEYLTLENPNNQVANVTVRYLPQSGGAPTVVTYTLPANSRTTIYTNRVMYNQSFSMEVLSDQPIVAERPMYFSFSGGYGPQNGGSDVIGYAP